MSILGQLKKILFNANSIPPENASIIEHPELIGKNVYLNDVILRGQVKVDDHARLNKVVLEGEISIGRHTSIWGPNSDIYCAHNKIEIGNFCSVARNVSIQEYNHHTDHASSYFIFKNVFNEKNILKDTVSKGPVMIGHDVWIGSHSVILSGSKIGNGAVVAANSVVSGEIPPYAIAGGSPARILKYRFSPEIIEAIEKLEWWNWSDENIKKNKSFFDGPISIDKIYNVIL